MRVVQRAIDGLVPGALPRVWTLLVFEVRYRASVAAGRLA